MTQPADTDLSRLVRDSLEDRAAAVDVRTPEWAEFDTRLRGIRTARHRRAALAGSVLAAAAVLAVGVTAGHLRGGERALGDSATRPLPTASPRPTTFPSKLDDGHVRGSLKHDTAWLTAFRTVVARDLKRPVESVRVAYASDVGNCRIAYVFAGPTTGRRLSAWYEGRNPARRAPKDMRLVESHNFGGSATPTWDSYSMGLSNIDTLGGRIAITTHDQTWQIAGPPTYHADGTVTRSIRIQHPDADGVVEIALPLSLGATYLIRATDEPAAQRWGAVDNPATPLLDANGNPFLTGLPLVHDVPAAQLTVRAKDQVQWSLQRLQGESGVRGDASSARGLWAGPLGPWLTTTVVAVTAPSGARLISVDLMAPTGPSSGVGASVRTVLPAGPLEQAALAWVVNEPNQTGAVTPLGVGVLGPVGAMRARTTDQAGLPVEVPMRAGAGFIPIDGPARAGAKVELLGVDGAVIATTTVLPSATQLPKGVPGA